MTVGNEWPSEDGKGPGCRKTALLVLVGGLAGAVGGLFGWWLV
jgi:hypothetical protein